MVRRVAAPADTPGATHERADRTGSKSARTRARVLDAAAKVLSTEGYAGMRLSDVAEHAELQAPTIYYYFGSREDLVEEVMWFGVSDMRTHLAGVLDAAPDDLDPMDRIMLAVEAHLRHELEVSDYTTAAIRNAGQLPEKIRARQREEETRYGEIWRGLIRAASADGALHPDLDPYIAQMLVMGALNWAAEWWSPERGTLDSVVADAQAFVRHGLGAD